MSEARAPDLRPFCYWPDSLPGVGAVIIRTHPDGVTKPGVMSLDMAAHVLAGLHRQAETYAELAEGAARIGEHEAGKADRLAAEYYAANAAHLQEAVQAATRTEAQP